METKTVTKIEDSQYFYSKTYPIKYYEVDVNMVLKPSALLNILQDMATVNAEMLGFGYSFTHPKNYGWFLIKYRMEFDDYPHDLDDVIIKTESRGVSKIIANRDFEIWTPDNKKRLGRVASQWMMLDLSTKSVLSFAKVAPHLEQFEKRETDLQFQKFVPICSSEKVDFKKTFEIRYDDIDVNQHVNNANYIVWAFETLPYEFREGHKLKTLDIVYKKEIAFGHNVISGVNLDEQTKTSLHVLKNASNDEELCFVNAQWV